VLLNYIKKNKFRVFTLMIVLQSTGAWGHIEVTSATYEYSNPLLSSVCCYRSYNDNVLAPVKRMCDGKASCSFVVNDNAFNDDEFSMFPDCFKRKVIIAYHCKNNNAEKITIVANGLLAALDCLSNAEDDDIISHGEQSYLRQGVLYILPGLFGGILTKLLWS